MKKRLTLFFISCFFVCTFCSCSNVSDKTEQEKENDFTLVVLNYGKYLNPDVIDLFEQETGITVKLEEYESPEEMYTKFSAGSISYDVVCTSDYMVERLIQEEKVSEIEFDRFSYYKNINPDIISAAKAFDPESKYSMPYFYGTLGILYNKTMVTEEEVTTWNVLWDETYRDSIIMQNSVRDSFTPALSLLEYDINTTSKEQLEQALDLLIAQKPFVYAYYVDETGDEMAASNAAMALVYSGEAAYAMSLNDNLAYYVPNEGSNLFIDSWFIPTSCHNKDYAQQFLDFLCRKDVALQNFEYIFYGSPNLAIQEELEEDVLSDETIFPSEETLNRCTIYKQYDPDMTVFSNYLWKRLKSE